MIEDLPEGETISFYSQGEFTDLCAGPHLMTTKPVKAFKLTSLAGAYWSCLLYTSQHGKKPGDNIAGRIPAEKTSDKGKRVFGKFT